MYWGSTPRNKHYRSNGNENRFSALSDNDDDEIVDTFSEGEINEKDFKVIIPPIIVDERHGFATVYKLLGAMYQFKRMSIGTKVISPSTADYEDAMKKLSSAKCLYYTHDMKNTKLFKIVLFGLPQLPLNDIQDDLKTRFNVSPTNIKEINTSRSSVHDAIYMLEFDRTSHTKREIVKIRQICGIIVHWRNPSKGNKGPTFCTKCTMYGHGAKNCHRNNICIACGDSHDYSTCPANKTPEAGPTLFKCFNCAKNKLKNTNHRADDPRCPCRKDYILLRQNLSRKTRSFANKPPQNTFVFNENDFPPPPGTTKFQPNAHSSLYPRRSYADAHKSSIPHPINSNDLFTIDELFNIFTGAITDLRKCTTKTEQLNVIMSMVKYAI